MRFLLLLLVLFTGCDRTPDSTEYPAAPRSTQTDDYHGTSVADPYRWLEDLDSGQTAEFVAAQNAFAGPLLEQIEGREAIARRLTELYQYQRIDVPQRRGQQLFYPFNDGVQDQDVLMVTESGFDQGRVLVDPNGFSSDATMALAGFQASPDGRHVAYAISDGGSDWRSWRIRNVETGADLSEVIEHTKFTSAAWGSESDGFFYSRYPLTDDGRADDSRQVSIYWHRLGTPQGEDRHVYSVGDDDARDPYPVIAEDSRYLMINVFEGYSTNGVYSLDLSAGEDAEVVRLLDQWDALYDFLGERANEFYFATTNNASNGRVIAIDAATEVWREVIPEADNVLQEVELAGDRLIAGYLVDATSSVEIFGLGGERFGIVELPELGTAAGFQGIADSPEAFFEFATFTAPPRVYRLDVEANSVEAMSVAATDIEGAAYRTEQVFFHSADGTRVPMFIIGRSERTAPGPTMLYGYGGFASAQTPRFKPEWSAWLDMGGVLAVANLRGGNEYGEDWHLAGTKSNKQNVFDDFIAAAEWLIGEGITTPGQLVAHGRSNGGLLVAAVVTQRPELFGAALPAVGVLDMLRYDTASANAYQWGSDFGWSEVEEDFVALRAYSPVHNVSVGTCYPPTLLTTADHDDRVVPWHSYKMAAELQYAQGCSNPILLRVETRAGHGSGKPTWMRVEDYSEQLAFAARHLGLEVAGL